MRQTLIWSPSGLVRWSRPSTFPGSASGLAPSTGALDTELDNALGHLRTVNARPLGIILNRVSKRTVGAGNYGHYGYGTDDYVEGTSGRRKNRR